MEKNNISEYLYGIAFGILIALTFLSTILK